MRVSIKRRFTNLKDIFEEAEYPEIVQEGAKVTRDRLILRKRLDQKSGWAPGGRRCYSKAILATRRLLSDSAWPKIGSSQRNEPRNLKGEPPIRDTPSAPSAPAAKRSKSTCFRCGVDQGVCKARRQILSVQQARTMVDWLQGSMR